MARSSRLKFMTRVSTFVICSLRFPFGKFANSKLANQSSRTSALRAVLQPHIRFCDELIADALSPLPRACGASAHQLTAADAPWAVSRADAFCPCARERSSARASLEQPARVEGRPRAHPRAIGAWRTGCGLGEGWDKKRALHEGRARADEVCTRVRGTFCQGLPRRGRPPALWGNAKACVFRQVFLG